MRPRTRTNAVVAPRSPATANRFFRPPLPSAHVARPPLIARSSDCR
ncbi:hypothetical protein, partial [Pseudomonas aeruginosa]